MNLQHINKNPKYYLFRLYPLDYYLHRHFRLHYIRLLNNSLVLYICHFMIFIILIFNTFLWCRFSSRTRAISQIKQGF